MRGVELVTRHEATSARDRAGGHHSGYRPGVIQPRVGEPFDRYLIEERLGAGGMGEVFRAQDTKLRRQVALKIVRVDPTSGKGSASEGAARLLREARAAAALVHPNAVAIFDVGELDGCAYIAMELIEGRNLRAYIGDASVPIDERVRWLGDVARALASAHRAGLVHRDVKPENVMIRSDGTVKVLDFGIARRVQGATASATTREADTITCEGVVVGTPSYMAPEQLRGDALDGRADQFAWGVLAYELLSGALPWPARSGRLSVLAAILAQPVEPLSRVVKDIASEVSDTVERAMSKSESARFADMDAVVVALGTKVAHEMPARRRRGAMIAVAGVLLIGAGAGAVAFALRGQSVVRRSAPPEPSASSPSSAPSAPVSLPSGEWRERRLTAFAAENPVRALAVTLDGATIAYADQEGVWTAPVSGGARRAVAMPKEQRAAQPQEIDFFPDGMRLLVGWSTKAGDATWIVPLDGAAPTQVRTAHDSALSPDGARVAFVRDDAVLVGAVQGGVTTRVAPLGRDEIALLAWSPSGEALAVTRVEPGGRSGTLDVAALDGTWTRTIVAGRQLGHTGGMRPTWTAKDRVAYAETINDEEVAIAEQRIDTAHEPLGPPRRIWQGPLATIGDLTFRAGRFFYVRSDSQRDVYVGKISADGSKLDAPLVRFTSSEADDSLAGWLPDGRVLFTSMRDGKARIYAQALGTHAAQAIVGDDEMAAVGALANGDVVAIRHEGAASSVVVASPGGALRELFSLGAIPFRFGRALICARCSTNGPSRCVIGKNAGEDVELFTFDPTTGARSAPLVRKQTTSLLYCSLSADASTLYLPERNEIHAVTLATGAEHIVKGPDSSYLQYVSPLDARRSLVTGMGLFDMNYAIGRMDPGGHMTPLWTSDTLWIHSSIVAPNGRDLAAVVRIFDTDVFMLTPSAP